MPGGIARVVVQVVTGDGEAKLAALAASGQDAALKLGGAFGKAGAVMEKSMSDAVDVALLKSNEYAGAVARLEASQRALATVSQKSAQEIVSANDKVIKSIDEVKAAQDRLNKQPNAANMAAKREAEANKAAADLELENAKKIAAARDARFSGGVHAAEGNVMSTRTTVARRVEEDAAKRAAVHGAVGSVANFGGKALLGTAAAAGVVAVAAVKMGMGFENAQRKIEGTTGQSEASAKRLTHAFGNMTGPHTMQSGQELEGSYAKVSEQLAITEHHLLGAGKALQFMHAASNLAGASGGKLENVTASLASTMQVFGIKTSHAGEASDKLFNASRAVNAPLEQMATTVTKLHGRLGDLGGGLTGVLSLMSEAAAKGLTGGRGVLIFNQAIERLTSGSKTVTTTLDNMGVHLYNSKGQFLGMPAVIGQLNEKLHGSSQEMKQYVIQQLFGKGATGEFTKIVEGGSKELKKYEEQTNRTNTAQKANQKNSETLAGEFKVLWAQIETVGGKVGLFLIPKLKELGKVLVEGVQFLKQHKDMAILLAGAIGTILAGAIAVYVGSKALKFIEATKNCTKALKDMSGMVVEVAKIMGAKVAAMLGFETELAAGTEATAATVDAALVATGIGAALVVLGGLVLVMSGHWEEAMNDIKSVTETVVNAVVGMLNKAISLLEKLSFGLIKIGEVGGVNFGGGNEESETGGKAGPEGENYVKEHGHTPAGGWAAGQKGFGYQLAKDTGLSPAVIGKWLIAEQPKGSPNPKHPEDWLNIEGSEGAEIGEMSPASAADATARWIAKNQPGILHAKGHGTKAEEEAINKSGWAATHYSQYGPAGVGSVHGIGLPAPPRLTPAEQKKFEHEHPGTGHGHGDPTAGGGLTPEQEAALKGQKYELGHGKGKKHAAALGIPVAVGTMLKTAEALIGAPYKLGGGHGSSADDSIAMLKQIGIDCSGFVSKVLSGARVPNVKGLTTEGLAQNLQKGAGKYVTVWDRANAGSDSHTIIDILGKYFESGGKGGKGVHYMTKPEMEAELAGGGFAAYHPGGKFNEAEKGGLNASTLKTSTTAIEAMGKAAEKVIKGFEALHKSATAVYTKYENDLQTGGIRVLEKLLGSHEVTRERGAAYRVGGKGPWRHESETFTTTAGSPQQKQFNEMIIRLQRSGMTELAAKLVKVHKEALELLHKEVESNVWAKEAKEAEVRTKLATDVATDAANNVSKELDIKQAEATQNVDAMTAGTTALKDAADVMKEEGAAAFQAMSDATAIVTETLSGKAEAIKGASTTKVAELEERGKYGLELQAQRETVALDQMKQQHQTAISAAKVAEDQLKAAEDANVSAAQLGLTTTIQTEDAKVAQAQAKLDAAKITEATEIQKATAKVGIAQEHADQAIGKVQRALIVAAIKNESKANQKHIEDLLTFTEKTEEENVGKEKNKLLGVESVASQVLKPLEDAATAASTESARAIQVATDASTSAQTKATKVIGEAANALSQKEGEYGVQEAGAEGGIAVTQAEAQTQYAGSGLVVNFTNIPSNDAVAIQGELGWLMRTQLPLPG